MSTQSSIDSAFSSDDDDCDVDQLAEEEARALELTFGSEGMFGLNEDHRRATYRNVSDAQKGESSAKSKPRRTRTVRHRCDRGIPAARKSEAAAEVDRGHGFHVQFLYYALVLVIASNNDENTVRYVGLRERCEAGVLRWPLDCRPGATVPFNFRSTG